jgi:hypothetical protein
MKNIFRKALVMLSLMLTFSSCDYLNIDPISQFDTKAVFSDVSNTTLAVLGVYDMLVGDPTYGIRLNMYYPYDSDEMMTSGALDNGRRGLGRYNLLAGNTELTNPWNDLYKGIERANICIDQIPAMDKYTNGTDAEKKELKRLHGEALTLRAIFYLELIRVWGDVPAPMLPSSKQTDLFLEKEDRDKVYEKLLDDLKTATDLVPWRTEVGARNERITKGAVKALRARIALHRGGYSLRRDTKTMERRSDYLTYYKIARDETYDIMQRRDQHTLNASFEDVFKKYISGLTFDPAGEIILELGGTGGTGTSDTKLGYYNGPSINAASRYGQGGAGVNALPTYFYAFDPVDTRRDVTIAGYSIGATNLKTPQRLTLMTDGKFRRDWRNPLLPGTAQYLGYNWPMIRFSDVLLMFAEAENEINGPTALAVSAYEEVRKRAFKGNETKIGVTPTAKAAFFDAVVNERLLEFGGEGIRKYDLVRWNLLDTKIKQTRAALTEMLSRTGKYANVPQYLYWKQNGEEYVFSNTFYEKTPTTAPTGYTRLDWTQNITAAYVTSVAQYFTPNKNELYPINQAALDANPKLKQDYGY